MGVANVLAFRSTCKKMIKKQQYMKYKITDARRRGNAVISVKRKVMSAGLLS